MSVPKKLIAVGLGATAGIIGVGASSARRWKRNPDPLQGEVPRFPDGDEVMVPVDDGAQLRVVRAGDGSTVVLVHGLTSNSDDCGPIARRLVEHGHRVIAVNQRGHGGSTVGTDGFDAPRLGRDLRQVLAALDVRDAVLVGHSMGGFASLSYAVDNPDEFNERVRALCLVATLAGACDAEHQLGLRLVAGRPSTSLGGDNAAANHLRNRFGRAVFGRRPNWTAIEHAVATALRCPDDSRIGAAQGMLTYDVGDRVGSIAVPTTVVCGTFDVVTRHHHNAALADLIPNARLVSIPDAGHMVIWEAADRITDEICAMLPATSPVG